jgi:uncharacterized protein (TIGR03000 family)
MRKLVWMAALSALALCCSADWASAGHHGGGHCGGGGCGGGSCGGGGCGGGSCGGGGYCGGGGCGGGSYGGGAWGGAPSYSSCPSCYAYGAGSGYSAVAEADIQAATLVVALPAGARLTIDDYRATSTSTERVFTTPALKVGQDYHYTLAADVNGRSVTRQVTVRGGETTRVDLDPSVQTASAR